MKLLSYQLALGFSAAVGFYTAAAVLLGFAPSDPWFWVAILGLSGVIVLLGLVPDCTDDRETT